MIDTVVLMPWRDTDPARARAMTFTFLHYSKLGLPIILADDGSERFNRAGSRNKAAVLGGDWEIGVVVDADCIVPVELLEEAIERAHETSRVVLPHDRFLELTKTGTDAALEESDIWRWDMIWTNMPGTYRARPSGAIVFPRRAWDAVGGYDQRFTGWGFEDKAMLWALEDCADGWERIVGPLWHLWHPSGAIWNHADKALFERYKIAHGNPDEMRRLLFERVRPAVTLPA
jgi:hypothetical protein